MKLEPEPEPEGIKGALRKKHIMRSLLFIAIGAIVGLGYFYLTEGKYMNTISTRDIVKSLLIGGFFGFFITNSPCARNKC